MAARGRPSWVPLCPRGRGGGHGVRAPTRRSPLNHLPPCPRPDGGANAFQPAARAGRTGGQSPPRATPPPDGGGRRGAARCVTPRQACPRPGGLGRNLRSKTRWFTGFCNSHQVSHFATFFIDARAEISVAESRLSSERAAASRRGCPAHSKIRFLGAHRAGGLVRRAGGPGGRAPPARARRA